MTRLLLTAGLALALSSTTLGQHDLSGTWTGSFIAVRNGVTQPEPAHMVLKHSGTTLTGTAGPRPETQFPIRNGKVDGAKVTSEVQTDAPVIVFELTLVEGHLKGQAKAELDGQTMTVEIDVQRRPK